MTLLLPERCGPTVNRDDLCVLCERAPATTLEVLGHPALCADCFREPEEVCKNEPAPRAGAGGME